MKFFNKGKKQIIANNVKSLSDQETVAEKKEIHSRAKAHFEKKKAFESDRTAFYKTLSKIGFGVGGFGLVIGLAGVVAVAGLTPLKTTEPYVIRVDNNTGFTDIAKPISNAQTSYGEELDKYWLSKFVIERESYDWQFIENSYQTVELMTVPNTFNEYKAYITSKVSPVNLFKQNKKIKVKVLSVSFINGVGQVRLSKQVLSAGGEPDVTLPITYWLATVAFDYKHEIKLEQQRLVNPLGFQVLSYRLDPENLATKDAQK